MNTGLTMLVQSIYKDILLSPPPSAYRHPVAPSFKCCWCCKFEMFSLPLLAAALLRLNSVSSSQHWQIRCWSCWVGWEEVCSPTLEAIGYPYPDCPGGRDAAGKSPHCSYGRWPCLREGGGITPQLPLSQKKWQIEFTTGEWFQYPLYSWRDRALRHISASSRFKPRRSKTQPQ